MATRTEIPTFSGSGILANRLVKLISADTIALCGAGERAIGVVDLITPNATEFAVHTLLGRGTLKATAAAAITAGAQIYTAADGKVSSVASGNPIGLALDSASGDGSIIEFVPFFPSLDGGDTANVFEFTEDFLSTLDTFKWDSAGHTDFTAVTGDTHGGAVVLTTQAANNKEVRLSSDNEFFKIQAGKTAVFEAKFASTQDATNKTSFFVGFSDTITAEHLADTSGAIRGSFDGFGIYKSAGDLALRVVTSNGSTQTAEAAGVTMVSAASITYQAVITPVNSTTFQIEHRINGVTVKTHTGLYASMDEMHLFLVTKTTAGSGASVLTADYVKLVAQR